jgi:hypothetical protein
LTLTRLWFDSLRLSSNLQDIDQRCHRTHRQVTSLRRRFASTTERQRPGLDVQEGMMEDLHPGTVQVWCHVDKAYVRTIRSEEICIMKEEETNELYPTDRLDQ